MQQEELKIETLTKEFLEQLDKDRIIEIATQILVILSKNSGYGYGICEIGRMGIWEMRRREKDCGSILGTKLPLERYTKEELIKMLLFAQKVTARYDKYYKIRQGANIVILDKNENSYKQWMVKRLSWRTGKFYHDTIDEAIEFFLELESRLD